MRITSYIFYIYKNSLVKWYFFANLIVLISFIVLKIATPIYLKRKVLWFLGICHAYNRYFVHNFTIIWLRSKLALMCYWFGKLRNKLLSINMILTSLCYSIKESLIISFPLEFPETVKVSNFDKWRKYIVTNLIITPNVIWAFMYSIILNLKFNRKLIRPRLVSVPKLFTRTLMCCQKIWEQFGYQYWWVMLY